MGILHAYHVEDLKGKSWKGDSTRTEFDEDYPHPLETTIHSPNGSKSEPYPPGPTDLKLTLGEILGFVIHLNFYLDVRKK